MALGYPAQRQPRPLEGAMCRDRLHRVGAAGGVESAAAVGFEWGKETPVEADRQQQQPLGRLQPGTDGTIGRCSRRQLHNSFPLIIARLSALSSCLKWAPAASGRAMTTRSNDGRPAKRPSGRTSGSKRRNASRRRRRTRFRTTALPTFLLTTIPTRTVPRLVGRQRMPSNLAPPDRPFLSRWNARSPLSERSSPRASIRRIRSGACGPWRDDA